METLQLVSLVEQLEDSIDELEECLEPLLRAALSATTKKLPLLDKAKLYVLVVYSIESLLFSYLRLNGIKAKDHPVFKELTRVKQYFEKIKVAEEGLEKPRQNLSLNKEAAGRIIKHALTGNDKYDLERAEREAKEKLMAKIKLRALEQKKHTHATHADADVDNQKNDLQASSNEAEDDEVEDNTHAVTLPSTSVGQENSGKKSTIKNQSKGAKKQEICKAERRAKRKRGPQDQSGPKPSKIKARKNK